MSHPFGHQRHEGADEAPQGGGRVVIGFTPDTIYGIPQVIVVEPESEGDEQLALAEADLRLQLPPRWLVALLALLIVVMAAAALGWPRGQS